MMRAVLLFLVIFLVGCASIHIHEPAHASMFHGPAIVMHGDTAFPPTEREEIERAASTFTYYTNDFLSIRIIWDMNWNSMSSIQTNANNNLILRITSHSEAATFGDLAAHGRTLGFTMQSIHSQVFLVMDRIEGRLFGVALHELFHVAWATHQAQYPPSLMSPHYSGVDCPSKETMVEFCKNWGCNAETDVRWCSPP